MVVSTEIIKIIQGIIIKKAKDLIPTRTLSPGGKGAGGQNRVSTMVRSPTRKIIIIINIKEVDLILIMMAKNIIIIIKIMEVITVAITTRKLKLIFLI